ncbi:hypothetical protein GQ53DRAFT_815567 [Thozetella sp. PMI_491]|nr:hypothetical protein GQ53DRAFT_815567 [Thozetella sp. PMI_491]
MRIYSAYITASLFLGVYSQIECINSAFLGCTLGQSYGDLAVRVINQYDVSLNYGGGVPHTVTQSENVQGGVYASAFFLSLLELLARIIDWRDSRLTEILNACPNLCGTQPISGISQSCNVTLVVGNIPGGVVQIPDGECCSGTLSNDQLRKEVLDLYIMSADMKATIQDWINSVAPVAPSAKLLRDRDDGTGTSSAFQAQAQSDVDNIRHRTITARQVAQALANAGDTVAADVGTELDNLDRQTASLQAGIGAVNLADPADISILLIGGILGSGSTVAGIRNLINFVEGILDLFTGGDDGGGGGGGGGGGQQTTTTTTTTGAPTVVTPTVSICDKCSDYNAAWSVPTPLVAVPVKARGITYQPEQSDVTLSDRKVHEENLLEKRAGRVYNSQTIGSYGIQYANFQAQLDLCPQNSFGWHAGRYPSTANPAVQIPNPGTPENSNDGQDDNNANIPQTADNLNLGTLYYNDIQARFIDLEPVYRSIPQPYPFLPRLVVCEVVIGAFTDRFGGTNTWEYGQATGMLPLQRTYHTEHVFELHIIKDFFYWALHNNPNNDVDCVVLQRTFGAQDDSASAMMTQLAWFDPAFPAQGFPSELFILNGNLNMLKGAIMNGRPVGENEALPGNRILPRPNSWNECVQLLDEAKGVMLYLAAAPVSAAFVNARNRVHSFLGDDQRFPPASEPQNWANKWLQFMEDWLNARQTTLQNWRMELRTTCFAFAPPCYQAQWAQFFDNDQWRANIFQFPAAFFPSANPPTLQKSVSSEAKESASTA